MNINQPITGTICINHFSADDIITNITLAKGAIPTIAANLPSENRENSIDTNAAEHNGANNCQAECCQKAVSKLNDVIANLEKSNSELLVGFHKKTQLMLRQIEYYKKTMNALQDRLTPSNLVLYKNRDKSGELNRKVKRLQDAIQYRNRRIKTIDENRKMERLERVENEKIASIAKVYYDFDADRKRMLYSMVIFFDMFMRFPNHCHLRKTFGKTLPHPQTIQCWYANSDVSGEAGIQADHIQKLKKISEEHEKKYNSKMICTLIFDEMNVRQQAFWSPHKNLFEGFPTNQVEGEEKSNQIAKQALAFMLNGVNCSFDFPICYWMIDSINAAQRMTRVLEVLQAVSSAGVLVKFLVFDGCPSNIAMSELLTGKKLDPFSTEFETFFVNPTNGEKIYIYLDPCHMAKLVRNTMSKKTILDQSGDKIEWRFITTLYEFSQENSFHVHKLTKKHINWERNPMSVSLAMQTVSNSVANAIELLMKQNHPNFVGAVPTIKFLRMCNTAFDVLNSKDMQQRDILKRPMNPENKRIVVNFLQKFVEYLKSLNIITDSKQIQPILQSRNKTGFLALLLVSQV